MDTFEAGTITDQFVDEYADVVERVVRSFLNHGVEANDLRQEIWARIIETIGKKPAQAPMRGWLRVVAFNAAANLCQKGDRHRAFMAKLAEFVGRQDEGVAPKEPRDAWVERQVKDAITALSPRQRAVAILWFEDCSLEQTAEGLGMKVGTVKATRNAAVKKLAARLEHLMDLWFRGDI